MPGTATTAPAACHREEALIVRATGAIRNLEDLSAVVVRSGATGVVRWDVATVRVGALTRYGAVTQRQGRGSRGLVMALRGADASKVVAGSRRGSTRSPRPCRPA
jgi:cobalt-zinc-cadmium resistance protein CzcA